MKVYRKRLESLRESIIIEKTHIKGSVAVATNYSVSLERILREFGFETLYLPSDASELYVTSQDVNRPGLLLAGRDDYFDPARVQILGLSELEFLKTQTPQQQNAGLERLTSRKPAVILITRNLECPDNLLTLCQKYGVPLLRTEESTSSCMSAIIYFLGTELAERITRHGVLVEVYGHMTVCIIGLKRHLNRIIWKSENASGRTFLCPLIFNCCNPVLRVRCRNRIRMNLFCNRNHIWQQLNIFTN